MEAKLPDGGHIHDRMRRVLAYWGDRERADTAVLDSGDLAFAGVSKGVFSAFHLPWIGGDSADVPAAAPQAIPLETSSRSEEHTSELQSLMRISYAVFCLKYTDPTEINTS